MKAAPEGVAMTSDTVEVECRALRAIRESWRSTGWPLDRLDGENGIIECLYTLRNSTLYDALTTQAANGQTIEELIEDLEDLYRTALQVWDEFRTVYECKDTQRQWLRWPDGTYPKSIRRAVRSQFIEMATTTRFEVRDVSQIPEILAFRFSPWYPVTRKHVPSLAAMVCIKDAIDALEQIEAATGENGMGDFLSEAWQARDHAALWLTHLETLSIAYGELNHAVRKARADTELRLKSEQSERNKRPGYRVAKDLTPEIIDRYCNERPDQKYETLIGELADKYHVSEATVSRRYSKAKKTI
jgi:hypothetical protein